MSSRKMKASAAHDTAVSTQYTKSGMSKEMAEWLQKNEQDVSRFSSAAIYSELRLQEIILSTEGEDISRAGDEGRNSNRMTKSRHNFRLAFSLNLLLSPMVVRFVRARCAQRPAYKNCVPTS